VRRLLTIALLAGLAVATAADGVRAADAAPQLRLALVARDGAGAFVIVRLSGDLPRRADGAPRATLAVAGRSAGQVSSLDRYSFRHYCFRAALRRPWPPVGRRVGVALRTPGAARILRTATVVRRAHGHDRIGARLGCRLPSGTA
jgi:hypothetical protein